MRCIDKRLATGWPAVTRAPVAHMGALGKVPKKGPEGSTTALAASAYKM